jgi:2-polyprenyl-6-hydroxyphenyl methylase/3-demethylubiquinone-9 3-methyltransferase
MSIWYDLLDWLGGYPFEVATPEQIFEFYRGLGYQLIKLKTVGGKLGCNEFVFERINSVRDNSEPTTNREIN